MPTNWTFVRVILTSYKITINPINPIQYAQPNIPKDCLIKYWELSIGSACASLLQPMTRAMVYEGLSGVSDSHEDVQWGWCPLFEVRLSIPDRCLQ